MMGLNYKNLDEITRSHMLKELEVGGYYESPRLRDGNFIAWKNVLQEAAKSFNDIWLEHQIDEKSLLKSHETRHAAKGITTVKVPVNAAQSLAEGEFNRFYLRGICSRAISEGYEYLRIYRAKSVDSPRSESITKIGTLVKADILLEELRKNNFTDNALGLPAGPNSGLSAEIVFEK
ncbi:MAG: hypothetical protein Q8M39_03045 [Sulfuricurvum sp.]|nr:hypothetical protein [Sulfuricurvum sp.]